MTVRGNILTVTFSGSREVVSAPLWRYDYGQILKIEGLLLPEAYEVHFSGTDTTGNSVTQIGGVEGVTIPDSLLRGGGNLYAWIYLHEGEDDGETEYKITIPLQGRAKPSHETPAPVQQSEITQAIAALNEAVGKADADALKSEGYAIGEQDGVPVESEPYYHNNAKWYAEQAEEAQSYAEDAQDAAEIAQGKAENAQVAAEMAQGFSEAAQTAAETAQKKAEDAQDLAETAQFKAEEAQEKAEQAAATVAESLIFSINADGHLTYTISRDGLMGVV